VKTSLRPILIAFILLASAVSGAAALRWTSTEFAGATQPLQHTLDVAFAFKNTGTQPVAIREVQVNCDCMTASADKQIYQPGEAGVISARFSVGDRVGVYQRSITVVTDDGTPPQRLNVQIDVPELAAVTPRVLNWSTGVAAEEKPVEVTVTDAIQINFSEIFVSAEAFRARVETLEPGRRYRMWVKPVSTAEAASAAIRLKGKAGSGEDIVVSAYANVR
jgi:hypothetical protein